MSSTVKKVLLIIAGVFGLFIAGLIIAVFRVPTDVAAERSVIIDQPVDVVFDYVGQLKNQRHYSVWSQNDPEIEFEFRGEDGTVGFVSAWSSTGDSGAGEQEIIAIEHGQRLETSLRFIEPFESQAYSFILTEAVGEDQTRVTWGFSSEFPRPLNLLLLFMDFEELIGADYQTGLENLKAILESDEINRGSNDLE